MWGEASAAGEFVVYFLFEKNHGLVGELLEEIEYTWASQEAAEAGVMVGEVLGATEDSVAR